MSSVQWVTTEIQYVSVKECKKREYLTTCQGLVIMCYFWGRVLESSKVSWAIFCGHLIKFIAEINASMDSHSWIQFPWCRVLIMFNSTGNFGIMSSKWPADKGLRTYMIALTTWYYWQCPPRNVRHRDIGGNFCYLHRWILPLESMKRYSLQLNGQFFYSRNSCAIPLCSHWLYTPFVQLQSPKVRKKKQLSKREGNVNQLILVSEFGG